MTSSAPRRKHNDTASKAIRLGDLEAQVMDLLWEGNALTVRAIIDRLASQHAYTTIATVLSNLDRKEMVTSRRAGRSVRFAPRHPRADYAAQLMSQALSASNDRGASILRFVDGMEARDVALLREYLGTEPSSGSAELGEGTR